MAPPTLLMAADEMIESDFTPLFCRPTAPSRHCYARKSFRNSTISTKVQQMAQWLTIVSWVAVILGLLTALAIAFDVAIHYLQWRS